MDVPGGSLEAGRQRTPRKERMPSAPAVRQKLFVARAACALRFHIRWLLHGSLSVVDLVVLFSLVLFLPVVLVLLGLWLLFSVSAEQ